MGQLKEEGYTSSVLPDSGRGGEKGREKGKATQE